MQIKNSQAHLRPIVSAQTPDHIPYKNHLHGKLTYITHEQFKNKFGCTYSENIWGDEDILKSLTHVTQDNNLYAKHCTQKDVLDHLKNPCAGLCLVNLGESVGHGVFTLQTFEPYQIVGVYAGVVQIRTADAPSQKDMSLYVKGVVTGSASHPSIDVDGHDFRGLIAFASHMPETYEENRDYYRLVVNNTLETPMTIEDIQVFNSRWDERLLTKPQFNASTEEWNDVCFHDGNRKADVQTSNLWSSTVVLNNSVPVSVFYANTMIPAGTQVGFSYGYDSTGQKGTYWPMRSVTTHSLCQELSLKDQIPAFLKNILIQSNLNPSNITLHEAWPEYFFKDGSLVPKTEYFRLGETVREAEKNYKACIEEYKAKRYAQALAKLQIAKDLYVKVKKANTEAFVTCLSTEASCYREQGYATQAHAACSAAMALAQTILDFPKEKFKKLQDKLATCP